MSEEQTDKKPEENQPVSVAALEEKVKDLEAEGDRLRDQVKRLMAAENKL